MPFIDFDPQSFVVPHWPIMGLAFALAVILLLPRSNVRGFEIARELAIVVPGYLLYTTVRGLVQGRESEAFARAADIIKLERGIHIFWETHLQEYILSDWLLAQLANSAYAWLHWPAIITVAVWLFFRHRDVYPMYRNAFLISGAIALVCYATLPTAPPRFMAPWGFVDTVAVTSSTYEYFQPPAFVNQYAALPSLHFGWNVLMGIAIVCYARGPFRVLGVLLPTAMLLSIVSTGNHFFLDAIAGGMVALMGLWGAYLIRSYVRPAPPGTFRDRLRPIAA